MADLQFDIKVALAEVDAATAKLQKLRKETEALAATPSVGPKVTDVSGYGTVPWSKEDLQQLGPTMTPLGEKGPSAVAEFEGGGGSLASKAGEVDELGASVAKLADETDRYNETLQAMADKQESEQYDAQAAAAAALADAEAVVRERKLQLAEALGIEAEATRLLNDTRAAGSPAQIAGAEKMLADSRLATAAATERLADATGNLNRVKEQALPESEQARAAFFKQNADAQIAAQTQLTAKTQAYIGTLGKIDSTKVKGLSAQFSGLGRSMERLTTVAPGLGMALRAMINPATAAVVAAVLVFTKLKNAIKGALDAMKEGPVEGFRKAIDTKRTSLIEAQVAAEAFRRELENGATAAERISDALERSTKALDRQADATTQLETAKHQLRLSEIDALEAAKRLTPQQAAQLKMEENLRHSKALVTDEEKKRSAALAEQNKAAQAAEDALMKGKADYGAVAESSALVIARAKAKEESANILRSRIAKAESDREAAIAENKKLEESKPGLWRRWTTVGGAAETLPIEKAQSALKEVIDSAQPSIEQDKALLKAIEGQLKQRLTEEKIAQEKLTKANESLTQLTTAYDGLAKVINETKLDLDAWRQTTGEVAVIQERTARTERLADLERQRQALVDKSTTKEGWTPDDKKQYQDLQSRIIKERSSLGTVEAGGQSPTQLPPAAPKPTPGRLGGMVVQPGIQLQPIRPEPILSAFDEVKERERANLIGFNNLVLEKLTKETQRTDANAANNAALLRRLEALEQRTIRMGQ